jgi:hypothetical protein
MTIAGVASALPQHKYDQRVLLEALQKHWGPKLSNPLFLERVQAHVGSRDAVPGAAGRRILWAHSLGRGQ